MDFWRRDIYRKSLLTDKNFNFFSENTIFVIAVNRFLAKYCFLLLQNRHKKIVFPDFDSGTPNTKQSLSNENILNIKIY